MRIDVQPDTDDIEASLAALHRRLSTAGHAPRGISLLPIALPGFSFRHREADGEHFIYVEDASRQRLAGYTVFNRLVEVNRRIDPQVRGPHSRYSPAYQRRGIATAVYEWALERGFSLVSGARQSEAAHALWRALGRRYVLGYVALQDKDVRFLGTDVSAAVRDDLQTRMILLSNVSDFLSRVPPRTRRAKGQPRAVGGE